MYPLCISRPLQKNDLHLVIEHTLLGSWVINFVEIFILQNSPKNIPMLIGVKGLCFYLQLDHELEIFIARFHPCQHFHSERKIE